VFAAERDVVVASAQVGSAKAQRYPRLTLSGSVGALRFSSMGREANLDTWSFGPLAVTLPLFDGGQRQANVRSAEAAYAQSVSVYRGKVRQAVREVVEALVNLQSTDARKQDAVYVFTYRGKRVSEIKTAFIAACVRAGVGQYDDAGRYRGFTWHGFRHTWATWHRLAGTPLDVLQKLGGWKDPRMVQAYAHFTPEYLAGYANNATRKK
jgi:hypothetical protein